MAKRHIFNNDDLAQFGAFNGDAIYSGKNIIPARGDLIHVVSGAGPQGKRRYHFHGSYRIVAEALSDKPPRKKYQIAPVEPLNPPVEVTREMLPDGDDFHTFLANDRTGMLEIPDRYQEIYDDILSESDSSLSALERDLEHIARDRPTDVVRLTKCRLGQGEFKKSVIKTWGSDTCALTGIGQRQMLIASHIKPWAECDAAAGEHLDGCNGILLASHIDKLFDSHLVTFRSLGGEFVMEVNPKCQKLVSEHFRIPRKSLHLGSLMPSDMRRVVEYLEIHNRAYEKKLR